MIGYDKIGSGATHVMVLNDWMCDTSTWDSARNYLDLERCTWVFADLRGYGRSNGQSGAYTVAESAADVVALADALAIARFVIVGHSMSSLVALHLAQHFPERIDRVALITPCPPSGFGANDAMLGALVALARGDDALRNQGLTFSWGKRLSKQWTKFKVERWRACADPDAVAAYVRMFACDGLPNHAAAISVPLLAVTGEQDAENMRSEAARTFLSPICRQLNVVPIAESGHYPMQEAPPLFATILERFLFDESS